MPKPNPDAEIALHKLGQRLREGWAQKHTLSDKSLETVKGTVREQWEQEQEIGRDQPAEPSMDKAPQPKPPEPDLER